MEIGTGVAPDDKSARSTVIAHMTPYLPSTSARLFPAVRHLTLSPGLIVPMLRVIEATVANIALKEARSRHRPSPAGSDCFFIISPAAAIFRLYNLQTPID